MIAYHISAWMKTRSISYGYDKDGRKGRRGTREFRHTTSAYAIKSGGEVFHHFKFLIVQLNIVATFKCKEDGVNFYLRYDIYFIFQFIYSIITNIIYKLNQLKAIGRYGLVEEIAQTSYVAVHSKVGMDDTLFRDYIRNLIVPLYQNISNECLIKDGKVVKGLVIFKTDSGPGKFKYDIVHAAFLEEISNTGLKIILSLPNTTRLHVELDQFLVLSKNIADHTHLILCLINYKPR